MIDAVLYEQATKNRSTPFITALAAPSLITSVGSSENRTRMYNSVKRPCVMLFGSGGRFVPYDPEARILVRNWLSEAAMSRFNSCACEGWHKLTMRSPTCASVCCPSLVDLFPDTEQIASCFALPDAIA